jgi:hypothetical protein
MGVNADFERELLKIILKQVREELAKRKIEPKSFIKHAWPYKYGGANAVEFHINKNDYLQKEFYWHGRGNSKTYAKVQGWSVFLKQLEENKIVLTGGV